MDLPGGREGYRESANAAPGAKTVLVDTPAGRLGLTVCYDLRFPELYPATCFGGRRDLQHARRIHGPDRPRALGNAAARARHRGPLLRDRGRRRAASTTATGRPTATSLIADYWGRVLAREPRGSRVVVAALDKAGQKATRESFPALKHRVMG